MKAFIAVLLIAILLNACAPKPSDHFIVYSESPDYTSVDLYLVNANSGEKQQITNMKYANYPSWSPDGKKIVFSSYDGLSDGLYTIDKFGRDLTKIIKTPNPNSHPLWSPDGSKIAFISENVTNPSSKDLAFVRDLMVVNVDGTGVITLANNLGKSDYFSTFSWSPDGKQLAFSKPVGESREIFTINADGTGLKQVTKLSAPSDFPPIQPAWSPDGKKIAFVTWNLIIINSDGTNLVEWEIKDHLTYPKWSPNGKFISCRRDENIILLDPTNGQITTIVEESLINDYSWSPQGDELAYFVDNGTLNIEKININSMQKIRITKDLGFYPWQSLSWQPR